MVEEWQNDVEKLEEGEGRDNVEQRSFQEKNFREEWRPTEKEVYKYLYIYIKNKYLAFIKSYL